MVGKTVAIVGGTGKTGKWGVKGALQRGHTVRILARSPDKVKKIFNELFGEEEGEEQFKKVTVVKGGVKDGAAVEELVAGADVVLSFLGMVDRSTPVVEQGVAQLLTAMKKGGGGKLVSLSAMGIRESWYQTRASHWIFGPLTVYLIIPLFLSGVYGDMEVAEGLLEGEWGSEGGLTTTVVRAPVLKDGAEYRLDFSDPASRNFQYAETSQLTDIKDWQMDRQDVAMGLLDCVDSAAMDNKTISLIPL